MVYPEYVQKVIARLEAAGHSAYVVGGAVRDMLRGVTPHDYDVATSALPDTVASLFSDMHVIDTGIKHGTVTVVCDSCPVEVTTYRIDGEYTDSRHPDAVSFTSDIHADLSRRDFTVNAMAYSTSHGLVDIFGGERDLRAGIIRAVGDARIRFSEDALRIMRAFRFAAQLGFSIEESTLSAAKACSHGLSEIARERIGAEFIKLVCSPSPSEALTLMKKSDILKYALGECSPSEKIILSLPLTLCTDVARLGLLLSEYDESISRTVLHSLRASGKQITGALSVSRGAHISVCDARDARRLLASTGIYAPAAAKAAELLGNSPQGAYDLVLREQSTPHSLRELKINGKDIAALGVRGKQIGELLEEILRRVVDEPTLNDRALLLSLAEQLIKQKGTL